MTPQSNEKYLAKFDELNVLSTRLSVGGYTKEEARKEFEDTLIEAYLAGFLDVKEAFKEKRGKVDGKKQKAVTEQEYDDTPIGVTFDSYYEAGDEASIRRLLESEYHRAYNTGSMDGAKQVEEYSGKQLYKTWLTMLDDRVREMHEPLEGVRIKIDDYFVTDDGDSALAPGGFALPENNANCRCILRYEAE